MTTEQFVRLDRVGAVAVVTLNRPERLNAMGDTMDAQFWSVLTEISESSECRAILWRAEGRAFSAGRDLNELGQNRPDGLSDYQFISRGHAFTNDLLLKSRLPIVVAIQGWCIGGTFERTLLCDLRIAADDAKVSLAGTEPRAHHRFRGTARLFQMCGHGIAADLVMTGRVMDADEAQSHGVVSRVVPRRARRRGAARRRVHRQAPTARGSPATARFSLCSAHRPCRVSRSEELLGQMLIYGSSDFAEFRAADPRRHARYRGT